MMFIFFLPAPCTFVCCIWLPEDIHAQAMNARDVAEDAWLKVTKQPQSPENIPENPSD